MNASTLSPTKRGEKHFRKGPTANSPSAALAKP
eukprot:CAMPEP_0119146974 /NCGR_PEP_ID=MMETSP1310-20130426/39704_1 /TAXON_ID=464262 /ORGANISM="Genus nov. species nov., Strain RCC2339" /LENGTH=32 /DNA_ID= /DNA_START= /DNA_END= /DNA_ORIENTATION=